MIGFYLYLHRISNSRLMCKIHGKKGKKEQALFLPEFGAQFTLWRQAGILWHLVKVWFHPWAKCPKQDPHKTLHVLMVYTVSSSACFTHRPTVPQNFFTHTIDHSRGLPTLHHTNYFTPKHSQSHLVLNFIYCTLLRTKSCFLFGLLSYTSTNLR